VRPVCTSAVLATLALLGCSTQPTVRAAGERGGRVSAGRAATEATASTDRQVMVTYPPAPPSLWEKSSRELESAYQLRTLWSWTMTALDEQCVIFEVADSRRVDAVIRRLASDPRVGSVQRVATFEARASDPAKPYNDPYAHLQHSAQALRLGQAHRWATGKGVKVAVVDTGIDVSHPDLKGRIALAQSFVDRGEQTFTSDIHGTAVAGVLAADANNEVGIVGVAPQAELLALKACWPQRAGARDAVCNSYTLAKAVDFAIAAKAQVVNLSLSGPDDPLLARLLKAALAKGIAVVAADGAEGAGGDNRRGFPASLDGVLGIAAWGPPGSAGSAGRPAAAALVAPAVDVLTTVPHAAYDFFSGSSVAAAQVSGIAALLLEKDPHITPPQIAALLKKSAQPVGRVDACAALATALGTGGCD
jgi:subtilisin family serine protease